MTGEQLTMFEPTGPQVLDLAQKHQRDADRAYALAQSLDVFGWKAAASRAYAAFHRAEQQAVELHMLAEFEALGGVS